MDSKILAWDKDMSDRISASPTRRRVKSVHRRGVGTINEQRRSLRSKKIKSNQVPRKIHKTEHQALDTIHPMFGHSPDQKEEPIDGSPPINRSWHVRYSFWGGSTATQSPKPYNPRGVFKKYEYKPSIARQCYEKTMQEIEIL